MKEILKTFSIELAYYPGDSDTQRFIAFLEDLGNYTDYYWDIPKMQYDLVKSDKEWNEFKSHPERQPYQIKVLEWQGLTVEELYQNVLEVIKLSLKFIKKSSNKEFNHSVKRAIAPIIRGILHSRYEIETMKTVDQYKGITEEMRSSANMYTTTVQEASFLFATSTVALQLNRNVDEIRKILLTISQQDISRIGEYFMTCQFTDDEKLIYSTYVEALSSDNTLEDYSIRLAFKVWKELFAVGLDIETFLDIIDYPNAKTVKRRLQEFLNDSAMHKEVLNHFKAERPNSYKKYKKQGFINLLDIAQEEAQLLDFPTKLRTVRETQEMVDDATDLIGQYFPIAQNETPRQLFFAPIHPFANKRAYQSHTYNSERKPVNIVVMTPSVDSAEEFIETLAHETTHAVHSIILKLGAEYNILTKQQADQVPTGVLEDFSQLVEGQFKADNLEKNKQLKYFKGKLFSSFNQAQSSRWQAPFGLLQIEVRERFEKLLKSGVTALTAELVNELRAEFNKKLLVWWETGVTFRRPLLSALSWVRPFSPDDGLVYMKRFIVPAVQSTKNNNRADTKNLPMSEAFAKRFGSNWIRQQDARILLYWLLLETGRNHKTETFGDLILKKDIRSCLEELQKISVDASEFQSIES